MLDKKIFQQTYKWEKGFVNVEHDKGGLTNDGITYKFYVAWCSKVLGFPPNLKHFKKMTMTEKRKFYNHLWERLMLDKVKNPIVAAVCYDFCFNSGMAKREIQKVLQGYGYVLAADNILGPITIGTINRAIQDKGHLVVSLDILNARQQYVESLVERDATQAKFLKGWTNRINDWKEFAINWVF